MTIDSTNDTLEGFVAAVSDSDPDIRAYLLNDGTSTPHRIVIEGTKTGEDETLVLDTSGLSGGTATPSFDETQNAQSARLFLDPGAKQVQVDSETNTFSNMITGVTIEAVSVSKTAVLIEIKADEDKIVAAIEDFVAAYNDVIDIIEAQAQVDSTTNRGGPLIGDSTLLSLRRQLSSIIASQIGSGAIQAASEIGISTSGTDGKLTLDEDELRGQLAKDLDAVAVFFAGTGSLFDQLRVVAHTYVDPVDGLLIARITGTNDTIADIDKQISRAEERLVTFEENLVLQFGALETSISRLQAQSNFLNQFLLLTLNT